MGEYKNELYREMTAEAAKQKIHALEQQIEALNQQIINLQKDLVDWHSAMFGALNLILKPYKHNLVIEREHLLNLMPTRIDCLIVKKDDRIPIELDAFRLFRRHNVIELKSYEDALDMDVIMHTIGYAANYISQGKHSGGISPDDVTITVFRAAFPRDLFRLMERSGWQVEEAYHNIFYLKGFIRIPIQIVVAKDFGEDYLPLQLLTGRAKEADLRKFAAFREGLTDRSDKEYADAVMWAASEANTDLFRQIMEDRRMKGALFELFKPDIDRIVNEATEKAEKAAAERAEKAAADAEANTMNTVAERMINAGMPGSEISLITSLSRSVIDSIALKLNRTVVWNEAGG